MKLIYVEDEGSLWTAAQPTFSLFSFLFENEKRNEEKRVELLAAQRNSPMNEMNCCSCGGRSAPLNSSTLHSLPSIHFFKFVGRQQMKKWLMKEEKWRNCWWIYLAKKGWFVGFFSFVGYGRGPRQCSAKGREQPIKPTKAKWMNKLKELKFMNEWS